jgi:acetylornithine/succinyldiaminopimelate/putrescine aminotransferase
MDRAASLISSTYGGDRIGLAAARAVLAIYQRDAIIQKLWFNGDAFFHEFKQHTPLNESGRLQGFPVHFAIRWQNQTEADDVLTRCAQQGVLFHRDANNSSAAMTEAEARLGARVLATALAQEK